MMHMQAQGDNLRRAFSSGRSDRRGRGAVARSRHQIWRSPPLSWRRANHRRLWGSLRVHISDVTRRMTPCQSAGVLSRLGRGQRSEPAHPSRYNLISLQCPDSCRCAVSEVNRCNLLDRSRPPHGASDRTSIFSSSQGVSRCPHFAPNNRGCGRINPGHRFASDPYRLNVAGEGCNGAHLRLSRWASARFHVSFIRQMRMPVNN